MTIANIKRTLGAWRASGSTAEPEPEPEPEIEIEIEADSDLVTAAAEEHWDRESQVEAPYWTDPPVVREYVNTLITGIPWLFPTQALKVGWAYRPFEQGLSIGCGTGELERDLWRQRICRKIDAFDISSVSLQTAKQLAAAERMDGIEYQRRDFNRLDLPSERYDVVFFHGSLHHVSDPDACLDQVLRALKPEGFLYIDEYVGPSQGEWSDEHLSAVRGEYDKTPQSMRRCPVAPPVAPGDPSEMIRSSRIVPAIEERFEIVHYRPYWGNLLYPLFCCLHGPQLLRPENVGLLADWIEREKELVAQHEYRKPLYAIVFARRPN